MTISNWGNVMLHLLVMQHCILNDVLFKIRKFCHATVRSKRGSIDVSANQFVVDRAAASVVVSAGFLLQKTKN